MKTIIEAAQAVLTEAKSMPKEVAIAVIKMIADRKAADGPVNMSASDRDELKALLPKGTKFTRDVPAPNKGATFGKIVNLALGGSEKMLDQFYFDGGSFIKGDKTIVKGAVGKKTFGELAKAAGVKF